MSTPTSPKTFEQWYAEEGFADEHRHVFALAWNAAIESAKMVLTPGCDDDCQESLDRLKG
jgi:hypothetical protein